MTKGSRTLALFQPTRFIVRHITDVVLIRWHKVFYLNISKNLSITHEST